MHHIHIHETEVTTEFCFNHTGAAYQSADTVLCAFSPFWPSIVVQACNNGRSFMLNPPIKHFSIG